MWVTWVHISPFGGPQIIAGAAFFSHPPPPKAIWDGGGCGAVAPGGPAAGLNVSGLFLGHAYRVLDHVQAHNLIPPISQLC